MSAVKKFSVHWSFLLYFILLTELSIFLALKCFHYEFKTDVQTVDRENLIEKLLNEIKSFPHNPHFPM